MMNIWSSNKQPNGSDLYINYFDWTLNNLYVDTTNTLTDGGGTHNRPRDLSPGIRIGEFLLGYKTSSITSNSIPTGAGQQRTFTVAIGLNYVTNDLVSIIYTTNNALRWTGTVISYNSGTGELVVEWASNTGTGTQATWQINLGVADNTGNLLANQAFLSIPVFEGNGQRRPFQMTWRIGSVGTGLVTGGFWGMKKFETRALGVITITNAGSVGNTIELSWKKAGTFTGIFGAVGLVARYVVESGDNIADVVAGLVASANEIGTCPVTTSDATTLTVQAPYGCNTAINGQALTVTVTGTVAGSAGNFAGGVAIESSTSLSNVFTVDNANNITRIEQANDNYNEAFTTNDGPVDYVYSVDATDDDVTDGTTTRTKISSEGSGILNWEAQAEVFLTTSPSSNQGLVDVYKFLQLPLTQTIPTVGSLLGGTFVERVDGRGIS
jgi:hypothetical protein